jgi:hypothetical protein
MWILASGDDEVHPRWLVLEHKAEGFVNRTAIDDVVVIEDDNEIVRDGGDFVEQGSQNRLGWWWLRGLEHTQHAFSNVWGNRLQSSDEVRKKASGALSPSSSESQAAGRSQPATHSPNSVVLPKPAGAEMRVSLQCRAPSLRRSIRRGRRTTLG